MALFESFRAIVPEHPRILILGTMPSTRSIAQQQYYAHPQNAFWPMLAVIYAKCANLAHDAESNPELRKLIDGDFSDWQKGSHHKLPYSQKISLLQYLGIALWDVLASCQRQNSSDQSIRQVVCNPIPRFLAEYPGVSKILLNGQKAMSLFQCRIQSLLWQNRGDSLSKSWQSMPQIIALPSSSPANASLSWEQKLQQWQLALSENQE